MGVTYGFGVEKGGTMVCWERDVGGTSCFFFSLFLPSWDLRDLPWAWEN